MPQTFEAFRDYMHEAALLSGSALRALHAVPAGDGTVDLQAAGLSKREAAELVALLPELGKGLGPCLRFNRPRWPSWGRQAPRIRDLPRDGSVVPQRRGDYTACNTAGCAFFSDLFA
ncbi:hypothetical protein [Gluconacetobacter johannae]|uniref:hypothetical protein n=1 Tax=Gluconacetobacter johannae TaxID=112140 RepID=UPI001FE9E129|nr:hypothetical protein [Gluconacetobacter johannae]